MRALLNAVLSYGLMNVPVGVCTATKRKDFEFRTLHKTCLSPISTVKVCATCQADNLQADELVKGYEFVKKQFIAVESEDLEKISGAERSKVIQVQKFIPWDSVDELSVEKSYFLSPNSVLQRPYALLASAMGEKEVVGLGSTSLWGKEYPSMVWARESGALVLSMLYCYDEVVDDTPIVNDMGLVPEEEQLLANEFVAVMMREFDPHVDLVSHSRRRVDEFLSARVQGLDFDIYEPEETPEPTIDVVQALRESIELARVK